MKKHLPSGWKEFALKDICNIQDGIHTTPNYADKGIKFISVENISDIYASNKFISNEDYNNLYKVKAKKNDIFMTRIGDIGTPAIVSKDEELAYYVTLTLLTNISKEIYYKYLYYAIQSYNFQKELYSRTLHVAFPKKINLGEIGECKFISPPLDEQKRIADILSTFDDLIENLKKLIEKKEIYKKGVMQRVLSGKVRFNGFTDEWEFTTLDKIIVEKSIRNKDNKINLVLSVTNKKGFVIQNEFFGKTIASKDLSNYKIVDKYDFAYNPARVNVGSISMLENFDSCIVSPMYVVFSLNKLKIDKYFFKYWIQSNNFNGHIRSLSAGSVRSILSFDAMSTMKIKLPSLEEQNKIAELLSLIDKDIDNLKKMLQLRKLQKKGVMQKLLTGEVRV